MNTFIDTVNNKFHKLSQAFRHFDQHNRMRITYEDFCVGLESMDIHISISDSMLLFNYIDSLHKNLAFITYEAFCKVFKNSPPDMR